MPTYNGQSNNINKMHGVAQLVLFLTSYVPLFILIGLKQIYDNSSDLSLSVINTESIMLFIANFWLTIICFLLSVIGIIGAKILFRKISKDSVNGDNVIVNKISNRNSESIGYIATYIVPFLSQSFDNWYGVFALLFTMLIIFKIYINSNLLLVNPVLSFKYSIFEIEYKEQNGQIRNGLAITKSHNIRENSTIKIYEIGFKLFFAIERT